VGSIAATGVTTHARNRATAKRRRPGAHEQRRTVEMKVVIFCGGLGTRIRNDSGGLPKPMVNIGTRPILWHILKYYAHFGHKDFILCLGYRGDVIKNFFLNYDQCASSDFTLANGQRRILQNGSDISDWNITFVDTGLNANIGQRLKAVQKYLGDDEFFLANYADALTDMHLPDQIEFLKRSGKIGCFVCVRPSQSFHVVTLEAGGKVGSINYVRNTDIVINGGYFVFRRELFDYMEDGEELVVEPFQRLIDDDKLLGYRYDRFWYCMDTFKEQQELNDMFELGKAPWVVWKK
jgi:glucose-1-phosphate cytidylyltransferase